MGDSDTARTWYRRVLETDPRNEEITQALANLDRGQATETTAVDVEPPSREPVTIDPSMVSLGEAAPVPPVPTPPLSVPEEPSTPSFAPIEMPAVAGEYGSREPASITLSDPDHSSSEPPAGKELELLAMEPVELESPSAPLSEPFAHRIGDVGSEIETTLDEPATSFSIEAEQPSPEEEVFIGGAADAESTAVPPAALDTALFGDTTEMHVSGAADSGIEFTVDHSGEAGADIERDIDIFAATPPSGIVSDADSITTVGNEVPDQPVETVPETAPIDGGHDGQEVPARPGDVFVTETMAELYLRQGHLESALDIYRRLVAQRPSDSHMRERLRAVEDLLFGKTVEIEAPTSTARVTSGARQTPTPAEPRAKRSPAKAAATSETAAPPVATGPSIREFLTGILARGVSAAPVHHAPNGDPPAAANESDTTASAVGEAPASVESEGPSSIESQIPASIEIETPEPIEIESGQTIDNETLISITESPIDTLFPNATPSESSLAAATVLADAFTNETEVTPLTGHPAHRAANELSLDHVFRANTPAQGTQRTGAFSFDKFFSEGSIEQSPGTNTDTPPGAGSTDDIAEFNAWLSGLKKT
jgi:hypothetical protein